MTTIAGIPIDLDTADVVALEACRVDGGDVRDVRARRTLAVTPTAATIATWMTRTGGISVDHLLTRAEDAWGSEPSVRRGVVDWLLACERVGLLVVRRSAAARLAPASLVNRFLALVSLAPARREQRRFPATVAGLLAACARMLVLPLLLAAVISVPLGMVLADVTGVTGLPAVVRAAVPVLSVLAIGLTVVAHEAAHLVAARPAAKPHSIVVRGMVLALVHPHGARPGPRCALAGPVAGATTALLLGALVTVLLALPGAWAPAGVVAVGHLASLLPFSADGRNLGIWPVGGSARP